MNWDKFKIYVDRAMDVAQLGFVITLVLLLFAIVFGIFVIAWNYWRV